MTFALLPAFVRDALDPHLPAGIEAHYYADVPTMLELAPKAEIGWFDMEDKGPMIEAVRKAEKLRWLNSIFAGLDFLPLDLLADRGVTITHGIGINAPAVAEYALLGMLVIAKDYRSVMRAQDRHEWLTDAPGRMELDGTRALVIGYGEIGQEIGKRLAAFGVEVVAVRRTARDGALGPDDWRPRLGEFDWVILALPSTHETTAIIGAQELAAMQPGAVLVNIARGDVVDQPALVKALQSKSIAAALLDVTTPEPLPADHPLWSLENAHVTMHLSGRSQASMMGKGLHRFIGNLGRFAQGQDVAPQFDPRLGY